MASISADAAARPAQKQQARRLVSRIVPAIPHRLSRRTPAVAPVISEQPKKEAVAQPQLEPEPQVQLPVVEEKRVKEVKEVKEEPPAQAVQTSSAPASELSTQEPAPAPAAAEEAVPMALASSPAKSQDEEVQQPTEAQGECRNLAELQQVNKVSLTIQP